MPYEATVPVHRRLLWPAVKDPERLLSALPNVVIDAAGAQGVAGRLRVRTREQTVSFRGVARIVEVVPTALRVALEVEAVFGRAGGTVEGVVEIALRQSGPGTRVVIGGQLEIAPGAAPLPPDSLDAAIARVVHRWFTALAETSPANRTDRPDDPTPPEPPRPNERAPLAVVRDIHAESVENGAAPNAASAPVPQAASAEPPEAPNTPGDAVKPGREPELEPEPEPAALRLVTPNRDEASDAEDDPDPEPDDPDLDSLPETVEAAEPEPDDIWSRLRDRSLPPWIPFLIGAGTATLTALLLLLAALRRRQRR